MKINRKDLLNTLIKVQPAVTTTETVQQSTYVCFKDNRVYTYNDKIAVSAPTELDITCAVPAQELINILNKFTTESIDIEYDSKQLLIKSGKSEAGLVIQKDIKLPIKDFGYVDDDAFSLPNDFAKAVNFCVFSASKNKMDGKLNNVHVKYDIVESCDNYRLTRYYMSGELETELLIPVEAAQQLHKYKPIQYYLSKGWMHFVNADDIHFSCRTELLDYVDLDKIMESEGKSLYLPDDLSLGLDRAGVFSKSNMNNIITINIQNNVLMIEARGDSGWFKEEYEIESDLSVEFKINPDLLKVILKYGQDITVCNNMVWFKADEFVHGVVKLKE